MLRTFKLTQRYRPKCSHLLKRSSEPKLDPLVEAIWPSLSVSTPICLTFHQTRLTQLFLLLTTTISDGRPTSANFKPTTKTTAPTARVRACSSLRLSPLPPNRLKRRRRRQRKSSERTHKSSRKLLKRLNPTAKSTKLPMRSPTVKFQSRMTSQTSTATTLLIQSGTKAPVAPATLSPSRK